MYTFYFEKLNVWRDSVELLKSIYLTTNDFPSEEKYGLTSQIRRASLSVPTNLAEGSGRITGKDQANFTSISYSSLMEVMNLLIISNELGFLAEDELFEKRKSVSKISNMLNALRKSQLSSN